MKFTLALFLTLLAMNRALVAAPKKSTPPTQSAGDVIPEGKHYSLVHEVLLNTGEVLLNNYSTATISFNNLTRLALGGAYYYRVTPFLQVGPRMALTYVS